MQTNRKSFGTLKSDRYMQVTVMDEWPLWQVLLYHVFVRRRLRQEAAQMLRSLSSYHKETLILHLLHQCSALPPTGLALKVPSLVALADTNVRQNMQVLLP